MIIISIFSGRFQPPSKGHLKVYAYLQRISGKNTFVATSNKIDPVKSPLSFEDKQNIWVKHGVPADRIVYVKNPYKAEEITNKFDPANTVIVFAVGEKDKNRFPLNDPNAYFLPYKGNENKLQPLSKHGYIIIIPNVISTIDGKSVSGTNIRSVLGSNKYNKEQKKHFFIWSMGWFDIGLFNHLIDKFSESYESNLQEYVKPMGTGDINNKTSQKDKDVRSAAEIESDKRKANVQKKKELDQVKKDYQVEKQKSDFYKKSMQQYLRYTKPDLEKKIKNLSAPTTNL